MKVACAMSAWHLVCSLTHMLQFAPISLQIQIGELCWLIYVGLFWLQEVHPMLCCAAFEMGWLVNSSLDFLMYLRCWHALKDIGTSFSLVWIFSSW